MDETVPAVSQIAGRKAPVGGVSVAVVALLARIHDPVAARRLAAGIVGVGETVAVVVETVGARRRSGRPFDLRHGVALARSERPADAGALSVVADADASGP